MIAQVIYFGLGAIGLAFLALMVGVMAASCWINR